MHARINKYMQNFPHSIVPFTMAIGQYAWYGCENQLSHYDWSEGFFLHLPLRCWLAEGLESEANTTEQDSKEGN